MEPPLSNAHVGRHLPSIVGTGRPKNGAFLHGQRPCLHAEVPAFAETLRAGRRYGTQAWSPAAGMESVFNSELTKQKGLTFYNEGEP
jgi:hypothetical protein